MEAKSSQCFGREAIAGSLRAVAMGGVPEWVLLYQTNLSEASAIAAVCLQLSFRVSVIVAVSL